MNTTKATRRPAPALHTAAKPRAPRGAPVEIDERRRPSRAAQAEAGGAATPLAPSAVSPTQDTQTDPDRTTIRRAVVRAILSTLTPDALAAVIGALISWLYVMDGTVAKSMRTHPDDTAEIARRAHLVDDWVGRSAHKVNALCHADAIVAAWFGMSTSQFTYMAHRFSVGDEDLFAALVDLEEMLETFAAAALSSKLARDLRVIAMHRNIRHSERVSVLAALFERGEGI